jgi:type II secretory ATPase GspE/PulE/Tfp pilus assembly ATPase PilB-like protein
MSIKNVWFDNPNEFIEKLVKVALSNNASDIHISPWTLYVTIKFRISWELKSIYTFSMEDLYWKFLNSTKVNSGMDISQSNHIQDGRIFLKIDMNWKMVWVNLRVSTLPTIYWENIVMRLLLSNSQYMNVSTLGYSEENTKVLEKVNSLSEWLVLVCWGTWSWKTTTLYSLLNTFDKTKLSIFTLEDPVEYQVEWYIQSQIKNSKWEWDDMAFSFEEWLIWILRQDPDIIMIWEIRRNIEAKTCFESANTGHMVLWTIHSNNSISVLTRVRQFWIEPYLISSWLKYVLSQKIVKWLCPHCKVELSMNKDKFSEKFKRHIHTETVKLYTNNSEWCWKCSKGYKWIILLWEVLKITDILSDLIEKDWTEHELKEFLFREGFIPYYIDWLEKSIRWDVNIYDILDLEY